MKTSYLVNQIQDDEVSIDSDDRVFIENVSWDTNSNEIEEEYDSEDENISLKSNENPKRKNEKNYNYLMHSYRKLYDNSKAAR